MTVDAAPARIGPVPEVDLRKVKWRPDSDPRPDNHSDGHLCRWVGWVSAEHLADKLDEWVGPLGWWATYTIDDDHDAVWCEVTVCDDTAGLVVAKRDVGDLGDGSLKNATTDAFKRCVTRQWGIGRNVREFPTVWAPCRVVTRQGRPPLVYATDSTVPTIERKLANLGHAGAIGTDTEDGTPGTAPAETANPPGRPLSRDALLTRLESLVSALDEAGAEAWDAWKAARLGWHRSPDLIAEAIDYLTDHGAEEHPPPPPAGGDGDTGTGTPAESPARVTDGPDAGGDPARVGSVSTTTDERPRP